MSLSNINIYGCLVCGKYFQGRGRGSWAYRHAVDEGHCVWISLGNGKVYVLPDSYEVSSSSLSDIQYLLSPTFPPAVLSSILLPNLPAPGRYFDLSHQPYTPGFIGLNDLGGTDYLNVVIQVLLHVPPLRDFLLLAHPSTSPTGDYLPSELARRFAALGRKVWNPKLFKPHVSPHEFLQEVGKRSDGKYGMGGGSKQEAVKGKDGKKGTEGRKGGDPMEFVIWMLNTLNGDIGKRRKGGKAKESELHRPWTFVRTRFITDL